MASGGARWMSGRQGRSRGIVRAPARANANTNARVAGASRAARDRVGLVEHLRLAHCPGATCAPRGASLVGWGLGIGAVEVVLGRVVAIGEGGLLGGPPLLPPPQHVRRHLAGVAQGPAGAGREHQVAGGVVGDHELPLVRLPVMPPAEVDQVLHLMPAALRPRLQVMQIQPQPPLASRHPAAPPVPAPHRPPRHLAHRARPPAQQAVLVQAERAVAEQPREDCGLERRRPVGALRPRRALRTEVDDHRVSLRRLHLAGESGQEVGRQEDERLGGGQRCSGLPAHLLQRPRHELHLLRRQIHHHPGGRRIQGARHQPPRRRRAPPAPRHLGLQLLRGQPERPRQPRRFGLRRDDSDERAHLGVGELARSKRLVDAWQRGERLCHPDPLPRGDAAHPADELQVVGHGRAAVLLVARALLHAADEEGEPVEVPVREGRVAEELGMEGGGDGLRAGFGARLGHRVGRGGAGGHGELLGGKAVRWFEVAWRQRLN